MTTPDADPAASILDGILHDHRQHVSANFPAPGICVSRCADSQPRWPCGAYRAAAAAKAVLELHRPDGLLREYTPCEAHAEQHGEERPGLVRASCPDCWTDTVICWQKGCEDGSVVVRPFRGLRRAQENDSAPAGAVKEDGGP